MQVVQTSSVSSVGLPANPFESLKTFIEIFALYFLKITFKIYKKKMYSESEILKIIYWTFIDNTKHTVLATDMIIFLFPTVFWAVI